MLEEGREKCFYCDGSGSEVDYCPECDGRGWVPSGPTPMQVARAIPTYPFRENCLNCHGSGTISSDCPYCEGTGLRPSATKKK